MTVLGPTLHSPRFKTLLFWEIIFYLIGVLLKWLTTASSESQTLTWNQSVLTEWSSRGKHLFQLCRAPMPS